MTGSLALGSDVTGGEIESAAQLIYGQVQKVAQGANFDDFGCDVPRPFTPLTCGQWGACCDAHDLCYAQNGCTASSWRDAPGSTPCSRCNWQAVKCITLTFPGPGPSDCCDGRNAWGGELCGTPRCPGLWEYGDYPYCGGCGPGGLTGSGPGAAGGSGGSSCDDAGLWSDEECAADDECDGNTSVMLYDGTECWE